MIKRFQKTLCLRQCCYGFIAALLLCIGIVAASPLTGDLKGTVVDGETHKPIERATVRIVEINRYEVTDGNGLFTFPGIENRKYTIEVSCIGYKNTRISSSLEENKEQGMLYIHLFAVPIQAMGVVVTGEHIDSKLKETLETAHELHGKELQQEMGQTLAATLKNETGLAVRSMGPAAARPVIRGLGEDRVLISEDGTKTNDLSATSPDHAVTIEPFTAERIEVMRGPKVLLRSSTTIGGIVNIVRDEIPSTNTENISGNVGVYGESANKGYLGAGNIIVPWSSFVLRGEVSSKKTKNIQTPIGELLNSSSSVTNYSLGAAYIRDGWNIGGALREYETDYGIPGGFVGAHPKGVDISIFKRQINSRARVTFDSSLFESLEIDAGRTYYHHTELEKTGLVGADFSILSYSGRIEAHHKSLGKLGNGALGVSFDSRDFQVGGIVFTPASISQNFSAFLYEENHIGDVDLQWSARYNYDNVKPDFEDPSSKIGHIRQRQFHTYSLSLAALHELTSDLIIGANISKSSRVPTLEELFSQGPHLAAYSYETGNPELGDEQGIGVEVFTHFNRPGFTAMLTLFRNDVWDYIIARNTGAMNYTTLLPVYAASSVRAYFTGVESQVHWDAFDPVSLSFSLSYTLGEIKNTSSPLPAIPPLKGFVEAKYTADELTIGLNCEMATSQHRIDVFEQATAGYATVNGFAQYSITGNSLIHSFTMNADNILDQEYRNHLSRVKSIMPEAGRNFRIIYRMYF